MIKNLSLWLGFGSKQKLNNIRSLCDEVIYEEEEDDEEVKVDKFEDKIDKSLDRDEINCEKYISKDVENETGADENIFLTGVMNVMGVKRRSRYGSSEQSNNNKLEQNGVSLQRDSWIFDTKMGGYDDVILREEKRERRLTRDDTSLQMIFTRNRKISEFNCRKVSLSNGRKVSTCRHVIIFDSFLYRNRNSETKFYFYAYCFFVQLFYLSINKLIFQA